MNRKVAIVGVGQTYHKGRRTDVSVGEMITEAIKNALVDAQLDMKDIDAVNCSNMDLFEGDYLSDNMLADFSGAYLKPGLKMNTGGTVGGTAACSGWYFVASGVFDTVLVISYQKQDEIRSGSTAALTAGYDPLYDRPYGAGAVGVLALQTVKYMQESGAQEIHGALMRVQEDKNAMRNPFSHLKLNLSVEDVLQSRVVSFPLRLYHVCPTSCGACAIVLASEEKADRISKKPVWYKDHVTVHQESWAPVISVGPFPSITTHTTAARRLFARNGIANPRRDLQMFEMYSPSSWNEIMWLEDFLICDRGEAWKLLENGTWSLEGEFPVSPSGGVVATNPIGATGLIRVAEVALQIRGDAGEHQVTRKIRRGIASAWGGTNWTILHLLTSSKDD